MTHEPAIPPGPCAALAATLLLLSVAAGAEETGAWRPDAGSGAAPATYAAPDGAVTMTIRCASSRGFIDQVFALRGALDLAPSPHGDGRMVDLTISYRSVGGLGGLTSGGLATATPREGGYALVAATTANSLPNLAAGEGRPAAFHVAVGGHAFEVPFLPPDLAARIERACDFRWYDHVLGAVLSVFYTGR